MQDRVMENKDWADDVTYSKNAMVGSSMISRIIRTLEKSSRFLELPAVSISYIRGQFAAHIPYKIGVDPTASQLHTQEAELDLDSDRVQPVSLFGEKSSPSKVKSPKMLGMNEPIIEDGVDPLEFLAALMTLHALLQSVDHLKITGKGWPARQEHENVDDAPLPLSPFNPKDSKESESESLFGSRSDVFVAGLSVFLTAKQDMLIL